MVTDIHTQQRVPQDLLYCNNIQVLKIKL